MLLFPAAQNRGHYARTTAAMQDGDYQQGRFIGGIGDEVLSDGAEPQGPTTQIGAFVPLVGKWHQSTDGGQNLFAYSHGSERIVLGDVLPNTGNVLCCFRVKPKASIDIHWGACLSRSSSRRRRDSKNSSPSMGFTLPLLRSS